MAAPILVGSQAPILVYMAKPSPNPQTLDHSLSASKQVVSESRNYWRLGVSFSVRDPQHGGFLF